MYSFTNYNFVLNELIFFLFGCVCVQQVFYSILFYYFNSFFICILFLFIYLKKKTTRKLIIYMFITIE